MYNSACSYFYEKEYCNALKWFNLALKLDNHSYDSYFGKAITCLKLGQYEEALETAVILDGLTFDQSKTYYKKEQFTLINAICHRILGKFKDANRLYN